jgi:hypothetical protein
MPNEHGIIYTRTTAVPKILGGELSGLDLRAEQKGETVIAYADDVTVLVTNPNDVDVIRDEIKRYEQATGARINQNKSHGIAIGTWSHPAAPLGLEYKDQIKILGITFGTTTRKSASVSWNYTIQKNRAQARREYGRILCLAQRLQYVQLCLLAKARYLAQVLRLTRPQVQQITTICAWFIWQSAIFRVPMTTLQRPKAHGGWGMTDIEAKCTYVLFVRMQQMFQKEWAVTSVLLRD